MIDMDALMKRLESAFSKMREASIDGNEGRIYLVASADAYGYEVDVEGNILLKDGSVMTSKHSDFSRIREKAMQDARNGPLWRDL